MDTSDTTAGNKDQTIQSVASVQDTEQSTRKGDDQGREKDHSGDDQGEGSGQDKNKSAANQSRMIVLDAADYKRIKRIINGDYILPFIPQYKTNCFISSALHLFTNLVYVLHDVYVVMDRIGGKKPHLHTALQLDFNKCKCEFGFFFVFFHCLYLMFLFQMMKRTWVD